MDDVIAAKIELGQESLDSTTAQCVAGKHLATMSEASRATVAHTLNKTVKTARNKAVKEAVLAEEYTAKVLECTVAHLQQHQATVSTMVHVRRKTLFEDEGLNAVVRVGDWVEISPDYGSGICSDGGVACVTAVNCGLDPCPLVPERCVVQDVDVHYLIYGRRERCVGVKRLTVIAMPYTQAKMPLRERIQPKSKDVLQRVMPPQRTSIEWLQFGLQSRRHEKRGWLRKLLIHHQLLKDTKEDLWKRVLSDYKCQQACIAGMKVVCNSMGTTFIDPRAHVAKPSKKDGGRFVSDRPESQRGIPKGFLTLPYLYHAYDVYRRTFQRALISDNLGFGNAKPSKSVAKHAGTTVIDNYNLCRDRHNARYFYARNRALSCEPPLETWTYHLDPPRDVLGIPEEWKLFTNRMAYWGTHYDDLAAKKADLSVYERLAREHLTRQPTIAEDLVDALKANVCRSYRALSKVINGWCSPVTIETWFKAQPDFQTYSKNIKPGLTNENRAKQVAFSQHVHNRWGLPAGTKILWLHCDEKWFHALVPRNNAKACEVLGIARQTYSAHHKSHIGKVMAHCTVGYMFDSDVEAGGKGFLIGAHRCAGFKIPLRDIRHATKDPVTKRTVYKGNAVKHHKGVPYLVNCNVTGSKLGTPTEPTFPLKLLWEHCLIPSVEKLLAPGGPCYGAQVILQEDNAGPHTEHNYTSWLKSEFELRQWRIELQAPQGQLLHPIVPFMMFIVTLPSFFWTHRSIH
jgi:hypothetical protein